jgi:hypothetical protein
MDADRKFIWETSERGGWSALHACVRLGQLTRRRGDATICCRETRSVNSLIAETEIGTLTARQVT